MADFLLGHEGTMTLTGTGTVPLQANFFNASGIAATYPLVDVTPAGATRLAGRVMKQSLRAPQRFSFDIMVDGDAATPPLPNSSDYTLTFLFKTGKSWAGTAKLESGIVMNLSMNGDIKQFVRYVGTWVAAVTVV